MSRPVFRAVLSLSVVLLLVSVTHAELYEVKLTRPQKVGDQNRIVGSATTEFTQSTVIGGKAQPVQRTNSEVDFELVSQALQIDEKGRATSAFCTIEKLVRKDSRGEKEILKKGDTVTATVEKGDVTFKLKEGELTPEIHAALREAIDMFTGGSDDDETFGTALKQKPGESWAIDPAAVVDSMARKGLTVDPGDVTGRVTLIGLKTIGNTPVLEVVAAMLIKKLTPPDGTVPLGQRIEKSTLDVRAAGMFPTDPALQPLGARISTEMTKVVSGKAGADQAETQATTTERHTRQVTTTPVK